MMNMKKKMLIEKKKLEPTNQTRNLCYEYIITQ